ncbi:cbb3-type cytochrome oxidase assembly protein CcoS [Thermomonas brevis]|uniref:Cbb3-type cytochrome oxidase assembly protein CcoS n=1 Tax=Thermomonas brevis TaxID=215691 RepID=A0A7G9QVA8_9GAMM|nr:cbb3-type cytochrome oxidase assembly protein CcoS [Thermomonas brevis]QNN47283.1 cbb3-type cytochrome oxidase assembly protein CcoS [Thermomonas brevis]
MNILLFLIPISLVMIGAAALLFAWAVRHGQFEDLDTPALDILRDDDTHEATRPAVKPEAPADEPDAG